PALPLESPVAIEKGTGSTDRTHAGFLSARGAGTALRRAKAAASPGQAEMKSIAKMSPEELAAFVCQSLEDAGITVTLTGGGCVAIWSEGEYVSRDLDFVELGMVPRREIRAVLKRLGFNEKGRYF